MQLLFCTSVPPLYSYRVNVLDELYTALIADIALIEHDLVLNRPCHVEEMSCELVCEFLIIVAAEN